MTHTQASRRSRGFTLSELLVALVINATVLSGALSIHQRSAEQYRFLQSVAELEERATFAMRALVADVQLAGFSHTLTGSPAPQPASARCNGNDVSAWAIADRTALEIVAPDALPCRPAGSAMSGNDVLITRHLDAYAAEPVLQAHAWYIDTRSSEPGLPTLRRQTLLADGRVQNQEIMPGIESLRLRAVVDSDGDGIGDTLQQGTATGALAVLLEITVRSADADIRDHTVRRLVTLRNAW